MRRPCTYLGGSEQRSINIILRTGNKGIPSSGVIVKMKFNRSTGSGKCIFIVVGSSSSVKSVETRHACQLLAYG